jgi:uncharacterized protein YecT (DUF1311 family)
MPHANAFRLPLVPLLLALAAPAAADELEDAAFVADCVEANLSRGTAGAELRCLGIISAACGANAGDEEARQACFEREQSAWATTMEEWFSEVLAATVSLDARDDRQSASSDALRRAQKAWQRFREAECGYAYTLWGQSTYRSVAQAECDMRQTGRRAIQLRGQMGLED